MALTALLKITVLMAPKWNVKVMYYLLLLATQAVLMAPKWNVKTLRG